MQTDLDVGTVTSLTINNYGGFTVDEIRIGSSYDVVTPVEAPSVPAVSIFALTILGASLALLAAWARSSQPSHQQHAIPIRIEPVLLFHCVTVGVERQFRARERAHQQQ